MSGPWNNHVNSHKSTPQVEALKQYTLYRDNIYRTPALFNVTGNHDIGYKVPDLQPELVQQYIKHFGPINYQVEVGGFNFVIISSLTLQRLETDRWALNDTWTFINALNQDKSSTPRIVLSHVPWWRPPETDCGRYNGRGPLVEREGYSYTNMLSQELTQQLLSKLRPIHVFSGDDHDQCEYVHKGQVPEHTIGTFSWMQGVPVPSFAILTLFHSPTAPETSYMQVELCFLPSQLRIYLCYALLLVISIGLFFVNAHKSLNAFAFASPLHRALRCSVMVAKDVAALICCIIPVWLFFLWIET